MFELGLRLAFDKPTIIIKDDKTSYSFDTSPIEHLEYPRDLRFSKIKDFGDKLASKIDNTYQKSVNDKDYSTFLKHFGTFKVAKIETEEVTKEDILMEEMRSIRSLILRDFNMRNHGIQDRTRDLNNEVNEINETSNTIRILLQKSAMDKADTESQLKRFHKILLDTKGIAGITSHRDAGSIVEIVVRLDSTRPKTAIRKELINNHKQQILQII